MEQSRELNIKELRAIFPQASINDTLSDDLFISEMRYISEMDIMKYPCRFRGYLAFFCIEGHFELEINLKRFSVRENSLFLYTPGNIVRVANISKEEKEMVHFIVVAISSDLMSSTRFDFNKLYDESLHLLENPSVVLSEQEKNLCKSYLSLINEISELKIPNTKVSVTSLISSIFYLMGALWGNRVTEAIKNQDEGSIRSKAVFENFLKLVRDYHTKERNLSFYADKLFLTPKYLSKLIKTVSGKSAHEWIDSFVILEAKNLLKYSDMSIKSIVYELNFPNQTTFYRFFKTKTGMTPSEYRKM